jgi:hypothetical protein
MDREMRLRGAIDLRLLPAALLVALLCFVGNGCAPTFQRIDSRLATRARQGLPRSFHFITQQYDFAGEEPSYDEEVEEDEERGRKSLFVATLLAIFPGMLIHGLGHYYAEDYETAKNIREIGEWGYLLTAVGGGVGTGAYFIDKSQDNFLPLSMYITGGTIASVGLAYFFTAWILDIYDVPRAVRTGGATWDFFEDQDW